MATRSRNRIFVALVALCLAGGGGFVLLAVLNHKPTTSKARVARAAEPAPALPAKSVVVRAVDPRDARLNGHLSTVPLRGGAPRPSKLACQRVYMSAGHGLCLALDSSGVGYHAVVFDRRMKVVHRFPLTGLPSRARVSADGRLGSFTVFQMGDSYATPGTFSTRTYLIDMATGRKVANLEKFKVKRDGKRIDSPDMNFWGVTFTRDARSFYATLGTGGKTYLIRGDVRSHTAHTLRTNVECPSLSPDGTRIAYKKRVGGPSLIGRPATWRLHVLNLRTGSDVALSEKRSIDDQTEWLDDANVVYGDGHAVFTARADGSGAPRKLLSRAASPAVLR